MKKRILVFHQPFPMGNYKLNEVLAKKLKSQGHDVYLIQQLNGAESNFEYDQQLEMLAPDVIYFEMLDKNTFDLVERLFKDVKKILCFTSKGILKDADDIISYYGKWYDGIMTNSLTYANIFNREDIPCEYFEFYHSVIDNSDLQRDERYTHDCCFLGMGFNRLTSPDYELERELFFNPTKTESDIAIYGIGWENHPYNTGRGVSGMLPPDDIAKLYYSSNSAIGIIAKGQRDLGMINNRYTEMAMSYTHIISPKYDNFDWHGLRYNLYLVNSKVEFIDAVSKISSIWKSDIGFYLNHCREVSDFMSKHDVIFYEKLNKLIDEV